MASKKYVYKIDEVNAEIDYEKLATAIVKAQTEAEKSTPRTSKYRALIMYAFNAVIYLAMGIIFVLLFCSFLASSLATITKIFGCLATAALVIIMIFAIAESFRDKDAEIINHFNSNVNVIALIIALVALLREVL